MRRQTYFLIFISLLLTIAFSSFWLACGDGEEVKPLPAALSVKVSPSSLPADGISFALVRVQARGEDGKPVPDGTQVQVSTSGEYGIFDNGDINIDARFKNGETQVVFISGTEPGYGFIGAKIQAMGLQAGAGITLDSAHILNEERGGNGDDDDNNDDE